MTDTLKIYQDEETKQRIESSTRFAGGFPLEAEISEQMKNLTLEEIGQRLTTQFSQRGAVGVDLIEIRFSMIFNPDKERG